MKKRKKTLEDVAINRIAALVLINALIFQEILSQNNPNVSPLRRYTISKNIIDDLREQWNYILTKINYFPIFFIAHELLFDLSTTKEIEIALKNILKAALQIVSWRSALRHDLAGRIYHRLLTEAKYLGAYYTSIPAAIILLKLALKPDSYSIDWSKPNDISKFRVADFACGTGTLLMAAADSITDNYIRACAHQSKNIDLNKIHSLILENVIWGFDIIISAIHLTASTLMLRNPDKPVNFTNLYCMPFGGSNMDLGSLEFINKNAIPEINLSDSHRVSSTNIVKEKANLPKLDLCVMNPPFTSSRRANLLFGNIPDLERALMQKKLGFLLKSHNIPASLTAGLGAVFTALADNYIKDGGKLALVLPRTILSGISWEKTRKLLSKKYFIEYIIVSHDPKHWNFSENTNLSEVLLIARKKAADEAPKDNETICVNLWKNPKKPVEALGLATSLLDDKHPDLISDITAKQIYLAEKKIGESFTIILSKYKNALWSSPCSFAQSDLTKAFFLLLQGKVQHPGQPLEGNLPICQLNEIADLGFDPRDIYDGFEVTESKTRFPTLWGHDSNLITKICQKNNLYLTPLLSPRKDRKVLRDPNHLWQKASKLLLCQRTRLNTKRLIAVYTLHAVLSDVWWTISLKTSEQKEILEKVLALWFNCSLNFLLMLGYREETEGAFVQFKKPTLESMPVLDIRKIKPKSLNKLAEFYDNLCNLELEPFPNIDLDQTRSKIDSAISYIFKLPELDPLRILIAREPILSGTLNTILINQ
jgi:hypothetical protein